MDFPRYTTGRTLESYSKNLVNIDRAKLDEASNLLKSLRVVVITGPPKSGKTSTAVALAKSYKSDKVLFLCSPDDIRYIDPRITLLVIIDDFGGKYRFDLMEVNKWFSVLDWLHEEIIAGKLQVIVTGETEKLQTSIREISPHPLLLNPVILKRRQIHVPIKQEPSEIGSVLDESQSGHSNVRTSLTHDPRTTNALHTGRGISASWRPYMDTYKTPGHMTATELQHIGSTSDMSNDDFEDYWMRLESATLTLPRDVSSGTYEDDIRKNIDQTRNSNMPNRKEMRQELCVMKEAIKRLTTKTEELNINMISVAANSTETTSKLRQVCVTKIGQTGEKTKRLKAVDEILCSILIQQFKHTLYFELPDDFSPPIEITQIKAKLREKHHVIIAGNSNSFLLKTALFVIRDLEYDINRCVEMTDPFDWSHIDPKDVDLVLCRDPFGNTFYDAQTAHGIANIFDSILHTVQPKDGTNLLDFILVTDVDYLNELKQTREHDLLDEVVLLTTSENQPVDLTTAAYQSLKQVSHSMDFPRYMTDRILDNYSENLVNIDEAKLEEASNLLKSRRMVVITGPPKSGKTSTAVALAKSYKSEEVLFLRSPGDIRKIDPRITVLVIIDDFGGKYRFDSMEVNKWFSVLDWLHEEVTAGKLQLIVTGETERLQTIRMIVPHPLLLNPVILTRRQIHVPIKQEPSEIGSVLDESQSGYSSNVRNTPALNLTTTSALHEKRGISTSLIPSKDSTKKSGHVTGSVFWDNNAGLQLQIANVPSLQVVRSVQSVRQYRVRIDSDKKSCYIKGCCILPGGEILLADFDNNRLKKLNSAYNVISVCDLPGCPRGVCYIRNNVAVVTVFKQLVYVDVSSMTVRNTVTIDHWCDSITCHNNKLYLKSEDTVYIYTLDGNNRSTLYNLQNSSFVISGIAVGGDGNRIYIADGNHRLITIDNFGNLLNSLTFPDARAVCVDDRGNVWVGDMYTKNLYQVSADGARLLGTVSVDELNGTWALCYDRDRSSLIVASGLDDNIRVVRLD